MPTTTMVIYRHEMMIKEFGGLAGLLDRGLLESAVARGAQALAYSETPDAIEATCAIAEGIVSNHPFIDGTSGRHSAP